MFFGTTQRGVMWSVIFASIATIGIVILFMVIGCRQASRTQIVPARYNVRETENGVLIFEYAAGNKKQTSVDSLALFAGSLNAWTREHPEPSTTSLGWFSTTANYKDLQNQQHNITVVSLLAYTSPSGKPKSPPRHIVQPEGNKNGGDK